MKAQKKGNNSYTYPDSILSLEWVNDLTIVTQLTDESFAATQVTTVDVLCGKLN
jgi:hypothetical protein